MFYKPGYEPRTVSLAEFVDRFDGVDRSIVVVNRTEPDPIQRMLLDTFGSDSVSVTERSAGDGPAFQSLSADVDDGSNPNVEALGTDGTLSPAPEALAGDAGIDAETLATAENLVLLVEDGTVVERSPLEELVNAILLVNSDLYVTGARGLDELDLPRVLTGLEDSVFTLRGYPESNRQKLLLITVSRFVERVAYEAGEGTLRSSFQRLSRLGDEIGTREVYERVGETDVDAHLYGVPDEIPRELDAVVHAGDSVDFTDAWFVVYRPLDGPKRVEHDDDLRRGVEGGVALLAAEVEPRLWRGVWTFDPERIRRINGYVERNL